METFHFALDPGGYLLLGLSETVDGSGDLYATISREHHLYQSRQVVSRPYPVPESIPQLPPVQKRAPEPAPELASRSIPIPRLSFGDLHQQILEQYAPPSIIINEDYDILHFTPLAGRYLHFAGGELSKNLLKLIRPELRLELRTGLYQVSQQQTNVEVSNLHIRLEETTETLTLHIRPVLGKGNPAHGFILVLFELTSDESNDSTPVLTLVEPMVRQLEDELIRVKAQLRSANEHYELQAEELKASNEELQAMNEELRSAAEELETSKEELQSINEELTTVNQELKVKVEEGSLISNNLQNLINSTDIATLFLDRSLRVNLFTPATRHIFNLILADFGRPLTDITNQLAYTHLQADAEAVLSSLQPIEREVVTTDGRVFIMRVLPYRTAEDRINGVVLTFVDITDRKAIEEALRESETKYRTLFDSMDEGVMTLELIFDNTDRAVDFRYLEHNQALTRQTGLSIDIIGRRVSEIFPDLEAYWLQAYERVARTGEPERHEYYSVALDKWFDMYISRVSGEGSHTVICVYNNVTERKRADEILRASEARQSFLVKFGDALRPLVDLTEIEYTSARMIGEHLKADQVHYGETIDDHVVVRQGYGNGLPPMLGRFRSVDFGEKRTATHRVGLVQVVRDVEKDTLNTEAERQVLRAAHIGAYITVPLVKQDEWIATFAVHSISPRDWTVSEVELVQDVADRTWVAVERAQAEEALRESEQRLASIRSLTLLGQTEELAQIGSWEYHPTTKQFTWSAGMYRLFELPSNQSIQPDIYLDFVVDEDRNQAQHLVTYLYEGEGAGAGYFEGAMRIRVGEQDKTLRIKAGVIGEGDQKRVLGVDLDITEQLQAQYQIRETAENLQAVLNASPASIALLKAVHDEQHPEHILDFRLAVGNDKLAQFLRHPLRELIGQSAIEHFSELLWDGATLDNLCQLYHSREFRYDEKSIPSPNQDRWLALSVMRQDDGVVLTGLDITELKQVQAQQQHWLHELETSRHSVDALTNLRASLNQRTELLRSVSHDLRGNFGVINGALSLLEMADSEGERAQMMDMVLRNVKQATGLLTDLLDLARLETGQQQREIISFNAGLFLTELGQSLRPMADEQTLALVLSGPDTLVVENDRQLVYRMAQNLIINALRYTHQGSVTVQWGEAGDRWWFEIIDTGPGLDQELVAHLNSNELTSARSAQSPAPSSAADKPAAGVSPASSSMTRQQGEGIGLRIVCELVQLLEARLQVISETGAGTRFIISLPLHYVEA